MSIFNLPNVQLGIYMFYKYTCFGIKIQIILYSITCITWPEGNAALPVIELDNPPHILVKI